MAVGIVGVFLGFIPVLGIIVSLLLGITGLALGIAGISRCRKGIATNRRMAIIGTVLSALSIALGIAWLIFSIALVSNMDTERDDASSEPASTAAPSQFPGQMPKDAVGDAGSELVVEDLAITASPLTDKSDARGNYVCTDVSATNKGKRPRDFGLRSFSVQNPSGEATEATLTGMDGELVTISIQPGGQSAGTVCFNPDQVAPGQNVVLFQDAIRSDTDRGAWLNTR